MSATTPIFDPSEATPEVLSHRVEELKSLKEKATDSILNDVLDNLVAEYNRLLDALAQVKEGDDQLKAISSAPQPPLGKGPFYIAEYEIQLNKLEDLKAQAELLSGQSQNNLASKEAATAARGESEVAYRAFRDQKDKDDPLYPSQLQLLSFQSELARVDCELWKVAAKRLENETATLDLMIRRQTDLVNKMKANLDLSQESMDRYFAAEAAKADRKMAELEQKITQYEHEMNQLAPVEPTGDDTVDKAAVAYIQQLRASLSERISLYREEQAAQGKIKILLSLRHDLLTGTEAKGQTLHQTLGSLEKEVNRLTASILQSQKSQSALHSRIATLTQAIDQSSGKAKEYLELTLASLREQQDAVAESSGVILSLRDLTNRTLEEYKGKYANVSVADKMAGLWREKTVRILNTELWSSGDYTVRLKSLIVALALLIFGLWLSRRLSRVIVDRISSRFKIDLTISHLIRRFMFYILTFFCFLMALKLVGIPLTAFAFLGGAFAIAIGFGAQNLFNNLISGILLAINRPFRIEDTIELDGLVAVVKSIGSRTTQMRTFDGRDVIVPNSKLMDSRLINWTRSDQLFRGEILIGISYHADPKVASEVMMECLNAHPMVKADPAPMVLFTDFGASSLNFKLLFWVEMDQSPAPVVGSELRYRLFEALADKGIEIPFPQMDVHLRHVDGNNLASASTTS